MVDLSTLDGSSLVPTVSKDLQKGIQEVFQDANEKREIEKLNTGNLSETEEQASLLRLNQLDPRLAAGVSGVLKRRDDKELVALQRQSDDAFKFSTFLGSIKNFAKQGAEIDKRITQLQQDPNANPERIQNLLKLKNMTPAERDLQILKTKTMTSDVKTVTAREQQRIKEQKAAEARERLTNAQAAINVRNAAVQDQAPLLAQLIRDNAQKNPAKAQLFQDIMGTPAGPLRNAKLSAIEGLARTELPDELDPNKRTGGTPQAKEPFFTQEPVVDEAGNPVLDENQQPVTQTIQNITEFDPNQPVGKRFSVTKIGVNGEVISKTTGLTASQAAALKVQTAGKVKKAEADVALEEEPKLLKKLNLTKDELNREKKRVNDGLEAVEALPNLRRGLELLQTVKTGGIEGAKLRFKQAFGVEGADEGELSQNLGVAVLSQLRKTFGAAFTEGEGRRLERIQANFGKSNAANLRLLKNAERIILKAAKRARRAAKRIGDEVSIEELDEALAFTLNPKKKQPQKIGRFTVKVKGK